MSWHTGPLTAFDTETTGVDLENDRIVTATVVEIVPGRQTEVHDWLIDPGIEIPAEAAAIHGVTTEKARAEGVEPRPAIAEIHNRLATAWANGIPVIAYNACFDLTILDRELRRHGHKPLVAGCVIDPLVIDKKVDRYRPGSRKLVDTCALHGVDLVDAHTSAADALAAARLAWKLAVKTWVGNLDLEKLHESQVAWYADQQSGFAAYLRKQAAAVENELAEDATDEDRAAARVKADELYARADTITVDWPLRPCADAERVVA